MNKKLRSVCIVMGVLTLFSSCKNFMQGSSILSELEKSIEYENSPSAKLEIVCSGDAIKNIYPVNGVYSKELKSSDTLEISIEEKEAYQFIKWTAEPAGSVSFEDATAHSTTITILDALQKITIKPLLIERPVITFSPSQLLENPRNSPIEISFSKPMHITKEELSLIKITSNGEDVLGNFYEPIVEGTKIIFDAIYDNLIPVMNGIRTVEVSVPNSFYYETEDENKYHITLGQADSFQIFSYKITPETSTKLNVIIKNPNAKFGSLSMNGNCEFSIGQSQNLICNTSLDYAFIEWRVFDPDGNQVLKEDYKDYLEISDEKSSEITITATRIRNDYRIEPYCVVRPKIVSATPLYDTAGVYRDRRITIMFDKKLERNSIYYTPEEKEAILAEYPDAVFLDTDENPNVDSGIYYGYQVGDNIVWKCLSIVNRSNSEENLLKYFQQPKFDDISSDVLRVSARTEKELLPPSQTDILVNVNTVMGVLVKCSDEEEKLVTIAQEYAWAYYTNSKSDNVPPKLDSLSLYIVTEEESYTATFTDEQKFFSVAYNANTEKYEVAKDIVNDMCNETSFDNKKIKAFGSKDVIVVEAKISDEGSGPKLFYADIKKVDSKTLNKSFTVYSLSEEEKNDEKLPFRYEARLELSGPVGIVKSQYLTQDNKRETREAEVISLKDFSDGVYRMDFVAKDGNDKDLTLSEFIDPIYFIYDKNGPQPVTNLTETRTAANKANISWKNESVDYAYVKVEYKLAGATEDDAKTDDADYTSWVESGNALTVDTNEDLVSPQNLDTPEPYKYRVTAYDWAGNASEPVTFVDREGPAKVFGLSETRIKAEKSTVTWTKPTAPDIAKVYIECKNEAGDSIDSAEFDKTSYSKEFTGLKDQTRYVYYATAYDWSGNKSETVSYKDITGPSKTTKFTGTKTIKKDKFEIQLNDFSEDYSKSELFIDGYEEIGDAYTYNKTSNGIVLTGGNKVSHSVKIYDYDYSGNKSESHVHTYSVTPKIGMILYSSGYWSPEYSTQDEKGNDVGTPIGIIWNINDIKKCQVWGLDETKECCWGSEGSDSFLDGNNSDYNGYNSYQTVCDSYSSYIKWTHNEHPSMWYYTYQKNNYASQKYSSLGITWFIPSVSDFNRFKEVYDVVENTINKLPETLSVPELTYDIGTTKNKSFENTYHPAITYVPNPFDNSSTEFLYLSANTSGDAGGHGIYWPVGFYSRTSYSDNSYPSSFYSSKTNHFGTSNANSPVKGIIDTHSTFVRSSFYRNIAHTMGQVDLSK